jgi:hypothetical protein
MAQWYENPEVRSLLVDLPDVYPMANLSSPLYSNERDETRGEELLFSNELA